MNYTTGFVKRISKRKKVPYESKIKNHQMELSFIKIKTGKLSINYFISSSNGLVKHNNSKNIDTYSSTQQFFRTKYELGKKVKKAINLDIPFYDNIPKNTKTSDSKILLTTKELNFVNNVAQKP